MSYQALRLDGNGYASIADASQKGLNMGFSDFMIEGWVKYSRDVGVYFEDQIITKQLHTNPYTGWYLSQNANNNATKFGICESQAIYANAISDIAYNDNQWHYTVGIADRSNATGLKLYIDGSEVSYQTQDNPTIVGSIDNSVVAEISGRDGGNLLWKGLIDEIRIWNFGKDGLPVDYADYIAWRYTHPSNDISEYSAGAWNGYADANRIERITYGALDDDNGDFEGAGADGTDISTNTDWLKYCCSAEVDDEAGSGVTTYNGSTYCCKIHSAIGDYPNIVMSGVNLHAAFTVGDWYEISFDYKVLNCTGARLRVCNAENETDINSQLTSTSWTTIRQVFQLIGNNEMRLYVYSHGSTNPTGNEVVWIDNISIKRIGLVAHYKFDGDYTDETSNSNDLTEGESGNTFPGYTLKKNKIIAPAWVR